MFLTRVVKRAVFFTTLTSLGLVACSQDSGAPTDTNSVSSDTTDYNLTLDTVEFMAHVLEPIADVLWKSAGWILDENEGYYELYPTDDEGWINVDNHGAMIVEAGNLMLLPGRVQEGPWATYAQATSTVGRSIMKAAEEQNKEDLFQAGAQLYSVCTACHQAYNPEILSRFQPRSLTE
ncbi:MAG: hypothetical protein Q8L06_05995 [Pseudohongiella sp.]|nr:hypothetical protein [Pseudohongiella sp.]